MQCQLNFYALAGSAAKLLRGDCLVFFKVVNLVFTRLASWACAYSRGYVEVCWIQYLMLTSIGLIFYADLLDFAGKPSRLRR